MQQVCCHSILLRAISLHVLNITTSAADRKTKDLQEVNKMVWTSGQRTRLAIEKEKLEEYFLLGAGVTWIDPQGETKVEVLLKSNSDKEYKLRIYIPADFPNSCPVLVVVQPKILLLKNGSRLPEGSYTFHTMSDNHGFHRICHFYPPDWTPDITLYQVFMKGRLWIEGYEAHLRTGKDMDAFLGEQQYTPRPRNTTPNIQRESLTAPSPVVQQVRNSPLQTIVRPSDRNTASAHYGNLSEDPVSQYSHSEGEFLGPRYVDDPVSTDPGTQRRATYSNPESNSRRNFSTTRSNSLGSFIPPPPTEVAQSNSHSRFITPAHYDDITPFPNLPHQNPSSTVPAGSAQELPQCNVSNEGSACDANNNEDTPSQTPRSRYRPAGAVNVLLPFQGENAPILRHVSPQAKPKPKPRR